MDIILQQIKTISIDSVQLEYVRDIVNQSKIVAKVYNVPREVILWSGSTEYAAASAWTNDIALARATEVLGLSSVPWQD